MASTGADAQSHQPTRSPRLPWAMAMFDEFYRSHAAAVYRFVYFRTGMNDATTGELVAEIFLALWAQPRPDDGEEVPLLYGVARRKIADYYRARERQREIRFSELDKREREWLAGMLSDREDDVQPAGPLSPQARRLIGEVLSALEAPMQDLLIGKYIHGQSVRDLAAKAQKSETAVNSALARARQALRQALEARMIHGI